MNELEELLKNKIVFCANCITKISNCEADRNEAEAVEHLARAISYLHQIKESEDK